MKFGFRQVVSKDTQLRLLEAKTSFQLWYVWLILTKNMFKTICPGKNHKLKPSLTLPLYAPMDLFYEILEYIHD